ncbi:MAG: fused MFS/spermidine synthase [Deltaproteobacteria bacterium]|nr:fused MFS/spermidine synthase [Deltaproteobacteria bacterium]
MLRHAATILLGAFLLFAVQPLLGKHLLPVFGGAPAVWTTCMLFFQVLLLAGYAYAHLLAHRLSPAAQAAVHTGMVVLAAASLAAQGLGWGAPLRTPLDPSAAAAPVSEILTGLLCAVGLPFLLLAATSPLLQAWFHRCAPGRSPYRLYVVSNVGSLLALLAYPFAIEPLAGLGQQAWGWAAGFALFTAGTGLCAWRARGAAEPEAPVASPALPDTARPGAGRVLLWAALAACGSAALLAVSNQICQEVASVPFLWIAPLVLYLLSFVLTFQSERLYSRALFGGVFWLGAAAALIALYAGTDLHILLQIGAFSLCLFGSCMVCHGELVRLLPHPRHLTAFYFALSAGGAAGGAFVALAAPLIFPAFWELHATLAATAFLFAFRTLAGRGMAWRELSWTARGRWAATAVLLATLVAGLLGHALGQLEEAVALERNFYGALRVEEIEEAGSRWHRYRLRHGSICHGFQFSAPALRAEPTTYYGRASGVGSAIDVLRLARSLQGRGDGLRIGVVGLGVGTLAAYGQPSDRIRFYEINPSVAALARGEGGFFSYLADSRADVSVALGDARLSIAAEPGLDLDLLVLDAFSSDSVPVHLLTREAFALYMRRLRPDGLLAVHATNNHLRLGRLALALAASRGLWALTLVNEEAQPFDYQSRWVLIGRRSAFDLLPLMAPWLREPSRSEGLPVPWTDDFSNLFDIL